MEINKIINQAINIMLKPQETLKKLKNEKFTRNDMIIYLGIVGIPTFIGLLIGYGFVSGLNWTAGGSLIGWGFLIAIIGYIFSIIGLFVFAYILNALATNFKSKQNLMQSAKLVAYSATPWLVLGIFYVFPAAGVISFLGGIYGLYILYLGLPIYMETPKDQQLPYFVVGFIVFIIIMAIVWWIIGWIWGSLLWSYIWGSYVDYYPYGYPWMR
jgi:hypothetical protein